jgi:bile acid:Na+ symporter, BASS family
MLRPLLSFLLGHLVFALVLGVGLATPARELYQALTQRTGLLMRAALVANIVVPLVALLAMIALPLPPRLEVLVLLMAICPGAPFFLNRFRSSTSLAADLLLVVSLAGIVTVPLWTWIIGRVFPYQLVISAADVLLVLLKTVVLPLALGLLIRQFLPALAGPLARVTGWFYKAALVAAVALAAFVGGKIIWQAPLSSVLVVVALTIVSAMLGHWAGGPDPEDRKMVANLAALGNPGLALAVVHHSYPDIKAGAIVIAYILVRALTLLPYQLWHKRHLHPPPRTRAAQAHA